MTTYYTDGTLATGANDGTSWADAWQGAAGLQMLCDTLTAGDVGYIRNTFTLAAAIDIDVASGTDGNPIRVIGCNAAGDVDGTKVLIDGDGAAANCLATDGQDFWYWDNVEFANATGHNVNASAEADDWRFHRCSSHDAGDAGFGGYWRRCLFSYTEAYNNIDGIDYSRDSMYIGCGFHNNSGNGVNCIYSNVFSNCWIHNNGTYGVYIDGNGAISFDHCVIDGNQAVGLRIIWGQILIRGCMFTNNVTRALWLDDASCTDLNNIFINNGTDIFGSAAFSDDKGVTTRITSGTVGYEDQANDKFSRIVGAAGYRTEVDIGGGNYLRFCPGLPTLILPRVEDQG